MSEIYTDPFVDQQTQNQVANLAATLPTRGDVAASLKWVQDHQQEFDDLKRKQKEAHQKPVCPPK